MDVEDLIGSVLAGALGGRRKRSRRSRRLFSSRGSSLINATTLLGAAGVAWGMFDTLNPKTTVPDQGGFYPAGGGGGPVPSPAAPAPPPEVVRLVRLAISASRSDGTLGEAERRTLLEHARKAGVEALAQAELDSPQPLAVLVAGITDPKQKEAAYALAFAIVRADEGVNGAERIYLAQLAAHLGLDPAATARIEQTAASEIEAQQEPA